MIIGERDGFINFYKRNSDGTLAAKVQLKTKAGAFMKSPSNSNSAPVVYDWNNDGLLDILTGGEGSLPGASVPPLYFENIGTKTKPEFADAVKMTVNNVKIGDAQRFNIDVADLNYDGKHDLLIGAGWTGSCVFFYENTGTNEEPTLKKAVKLQKTDGSDLRGNMDLKVYVTDWNEDGGLDLLVGSLEKSEGIKVYLGDVMVDIAQDKKNIPNAAVKSYTFNNGQLSVNLYLKKSRAITFHFSSLNGRLVHKENVGTLQVGKNRVMFDLGFLPTGTYVMHCITNGHYVEERKIVLCK